jgi:hypothetical protein
VALFFKEYKLNNFLPPKKMNGLCARMNQLMEEGYSMRAASRIMEQECNGKYSAATILKMFYYWTAENFSTHRTKGTGQNECFTPQIYIKAAREVMGDIDLDPATSILNTLRFLYRSSSSIIDIKPAPCTPRVCQLMGQVADRVEFSSERANSNSE